MEHPKPVAGTAIPPTLRPEHLDVLDAIRDVVDREVRPHAAGWNRAHTVPRELLRRLGELGLLAVTVPEEHGGAGLDHAALCIVVEELARADAGIAVAVAVQAGLACSPILRHGTDEHRARFLPGLASGDLIGAYCLTEPDAGSDIAAMRSTATALPDGGLQLSGTKTWITNGGIADVFVVFARHGEAHGAFLATREDGVRTGAELGKLGLHTSSTVEVLLDDVRLPAGRGLGEEGRGLALALATLDGGRITIAAQACGIARAALDLAVAYASERTAFGGPIGRFQGIQFPLAELAARLDAARLLVYHAAALRDAGRPHGVEGAKAKLLASRIAVEAADVAVQTLGGYGYSDEYPAERLMRDAKITELYEGTSEIQRLVIARGLFGRIG